MTLLISPAHTWECASLLRSFLSWYGLVPLYVAWTSSPLEFIMCRDTVLWLKYEIGCRIPQIIAGFLTTPNWGGHMLL